MKKSARFSLPLFLSALLSVMLSACASDATRKESVMREVDYGEVRVTEHRGHDDLLSAGLGLAGLAGMPSPAPPSDTVVRAIGGLAPAAAILVAVALGAMLVRLHGRMEGWRAALAILAALIIYSVLR